MTLTKDQRHYRKKKKESKKDFKRTTSDTGKPSIQVTQKKVNVRVSDEAYERFEERVTEEGTTKSGLLERMVIQGLPRYSWHTGEMGTNQYYWDEPKNPKTRKRRGKAGDRQISLWISSTAWRKLEIHADTIGESKSRIIDRLLRE